MRTRWYQQQIDVKSAKSALDKTAEHFRQYTTLTSMFLNWLPEAEQVLYDRASGWQVHSSLQSSVFCAVVRLLSSL